MARKKKDFLDGLDFDLQWGYKGLKISSILLIALIVGLYLLFSVLDGDFSKVTSSILKLPQGADYFGIFAGVIIFIVIPFIIGIKIGLGAKK